MQIILQSVYFSYDKVNKKKFKYDDYTVKNINMHIQQGEFIAIAGHSGSGKSTLIQLIKGLFSPTEGTLLLAGENPWDRQQRRCTQQKGNKTQFDSIGLVFQYPEHQLFAATVYEDIAFGPTQQVKQEVLDRPAEQWVQERVKRAMQKMNLEDERFQDSNPFDLSGGERRRVAIAGVLAAEPQILILDEPTAGMDHFARTSLFQTLHQLNQQENVTIILVSHRLEEILAHASRLMLMGDGQILRDGDPRKLLADFAFLESIQMEKIEPMQFSIALAEFGISVQDPSNVSEVSQAIKNYLTATAR
ncbi:MAG: putative cobalt transporter ATPase [Bacilli bacterium]|nr:putative cobalt transporter ATPase [Bacilli bacterium]